MERRNTRVTRADIKDSVVRDVWVRAAGRCVLCSAYLLGGDPSYFHTAAHGEVAHNIGATAGTRSPRGRSTLTLEQRALAENLLLLCHQCHRQIDAPGAEKVYTEVYLTDHKRRHEARVRKATDFPTVHETAVLRVTARVRGTLAPATDRQIAAALHYEDLRHAGDHPRDAEFELKLESDETDEWVWKEGAKKISKRLSSLRESHSGTLSVFAIAPVPLLVYLGALLDDKDDIRIFPRFRDAEDLSWCWRNEPTEPPAFLVQTTVAAPDATQVVLAVSVTAPVTVEEGPDSVHDLPRVELAVATPSPDVIQTKEALHTFAAAWREALATVEREYPRCRTIHLLAAVPLTAAIVCGQHHMRDAQPEMVVYQRAREQYVEALRVGTSAS